MKITQIYHKKNELLKEEFYKDKGCTEALVLDYNAKYYIENFNLLPFYSGLNWHWKYEIPCIYTGYVPRGYSTSMNVKTLDDITLNLPKYVSEDNAVLFLSEEDENNYLFYLTQSDIPNAVYPKVATSISTKNSTKKLKQTIFLTHGTEAEFEKANEVAKELVEEYGVEEVNLVVKHWFLKFLHSNDLWFQDFIFTPISQEERDKVKQGKDDTGYGKSLEERLFINKIITTNSTGILPVQDSERLQVIDCKDIFKEYSKGRN